MEVSKLNILDEINKSNIIILLATDANLFKFGFGFEDAVYKLLSDEKIQTRTTVDERIRFIEQVIRKDKNWMKEIERKAKERKLPVDTMLHRDAHWIFEKENHEKK
jgi:hypothetical protein